MFGFLHQTEILPSGFRVSEFEEIAALKPPEVLVGGSRNFAPFEVGPAQGFLLLGVTQGPGSRFR